MGPKCPDLAMKADSAEHVPRPANSFILFRTDFVKKNPKNGSGSSNQIDLNPDASEAWNALSNFEKSRWKAKALEIVEEHKRKHPNYKYSPTKKKSQARQTGTGKKATTPRTKAASSSASTPLTFGPTSEGLTELILDIQVENPQPASSDTFPMLLGWLVEDNNAESVPTMLQKSKEKSCIQYAAEESEHGSEHV